MKWTKNRPVKEGYYWVKFEQEDIHQQGPMVFDIDYCEEDQEFSIGELGGDYFRSIDEFENEHGKIELWSDDPIEPPNG